LAYQGACDVVSDSMTGMFPTSWRSPAAGVRLFSRFDLLGAQLDAVGGGVLLDEGNLLERFCYLGSTREESREHFRWHRVERECVTRRFSVSTISLKLMKSATRGARKECVGRRDAARSPAERGIPRLSTFALCCRLRALVASQGKKRATGQIVIL
jgi:hypothetical protein